MQRGLTGHYVPVSSAGEECRAFVPKPLPPDPPLVRDAELLDLHAQATLALGRLDGLAAILPRTGLFLYSYIRKEAVLSSQIEGTQSSLSELLLFESAAAPGVPLDDVLEVSNYVAAMTCGIKRLRTSDSRLSIRSSTATDDWAVCSSRCCFARNTRCAHRCSTSASTSRSIASNTTTCSKFAQPPGPNMAASTLTTAT